MLLGQIKPLTIPVVTPACDQKPLASLTKLLAHIALQMTTQETLPMLGAGAELHMHMQGLKGSE